MTGIRRQVYAARRSKTDQLALASFEGETLAPLLNRDEAIRLALDILDLFDAFPASRASAPTLPEEQIQRIMDDFLKLLGVTRPRTEADLSSPAPAPTVKE